MDEQKIAITIGKILLLIIVIVLFYFWVTNSLKLDTVKNELDSVKKELDNTNKNLSECNRLRTQDDLTRINILNNRLDAYKNLISKINNFVLSYSNQSIDNETRTTISNLSNVFTKILTDIDKTTDWEIMLQNISIVFNKVIDNIINSNTKLSSFKQIAIGLRDQINQSITNAINPDLNQNILSSPVEQMFDDSKGNFEYNSTNINSLGNYIASTQYLSNTINPNRNISTFNDLKNIYTNLTNDKNSLQTQIDTLSSSINTTSNYIANNTSNYTDTEFQNNGDININSLPNTNILSTSVNLSNISNINGTNLDSLLKYIRCASYLLNKLNQLVNGNTSVRNFKQLLLDYQNQITNYRNQITKYIKVGNTIPIRFLENTILFGMKIANERIFGPDGIDYSASVSNALRSNALNDCNSLNHCSSITFNTNYALQQPVYVQGDHTNINQLLSFQKLFTQINVELTFMITRVTNIVITKNNVSYDLMTNPTIGTTTLTVYPNNVFGRNNIKIIHIVPDIEQLSPFSWRIDAVGEIAISYNINAAGLLTKNGTTSFFKSTLVKDQSSNVMISKPDLIDWSQFDYNDVNKTVDLTLLNQNGIIFRNTTLTINSYNNITSIPVSNPGYTNDFNLITNNIGPYKGVLMDIQSTPTNYNTYWWQIVTDYSTTQKITLNRVFSYYTRQHDFYLAPGVTDVNFDF